MGRFVRYYFLLFLSFPVGFGCRCASASRPGHCLAGNVGSGGVKTFSTMGAVFTLATELECVGRKYECNLIVTHRTILDVTVHMEHRFIDHIDVRSRDGSSRKMLVGTVFPRGGNRANGDEAVTSPPQQIQQQEWLYVVGNESVNTAWAERNKIFELLSNGAIQQARDAYAKLQLASSLPAQPYDGLEALLAQEAA